MIKEFAKYYKPHMRLFLLDVLCAAVLSIIDLIFPMFSRVFINDLIPNGKVQAMITFSVMIFVLYIVRMGCGYFMAYWGHVCGGRIEFDMRSKLFNHIQTLPIKYFDDNKTGQIMNRMTGDLAEIGELAHHGPEDLFISGLMLGGSFFLLLFINVKLTLVLFTLVILIIIFSINRRSSMTSSFRNVRKQHSEINSKIENSISGIRLSKSFVNENYEKLKFDESNIEHLESKKEGYRAIGTFVAGTTFFTDNLNLVVISLGGYFVYKGQMNYGDLVAYLLYTTFFIRPIRNLVQFTQQYHMGMTGFERMQEILHIKPEAHGKNGCVVLTETKGEIKFQNVDFKYEAENEYVLKDFSLNVEGGKTIALVGPSGVGKTTISNLIPRFYERSGGEILIDGHNIDDIKIESLRTNIGIVQQDVFVFYGTLKENILYGKPSATDEEIYQATTDANIHDFILSLPHGYETIVGERGIKLSGGQKQRIAIARVFLKNPPILILDEATSSLDNATELAIQSSIERLAANRTTIIIAHRLSTIKNADEIIVLDDCGIIERGNHEDLISRKGVYSNLYNAQFKGFIPDEIVGE